MAEAARLRDLGHGNIVSYSRKVFIPLTRLCRDICRYCTFVRGPRGVASAYLSPDEVLAIARAGVDAGCQEALFTLGDKPELQYEAARRALARLGYADHDRLSRRDVRAGAARNRPAAARQSRRDERGGHRGAAPRVGVAGHDAGERLAAAVRSAADRITARPTSIRRCGSPPSRRPGELKVPFTTGILIGIGETRAERIDSLLAIDALHRRHGHIQEVIVQNFRAKDGTGMARAPEPGVDDLLWTVAMARIVFGPEMNIQAPPNLSPGLDRRSDRGRHQRLGRRLAGDARPRQSGSAVAAIERLRAGNRGAPARCLTERLAIYPEYVREPERWLDPSAAARPCCARRRRRLCARRRLGAGRERAAPTGRLSPASAADRVDTGSSTASSRRASAGQRLERGRHRHAVRGARRRIRRGLRRGRRAAPERQRRHRQLRRQPQHQLHQRLQLRLPVLRLLQGQARRQPARPGLRPRSSRRSRAACAKPGIAAPPKSACRAASIRDYTGDDLSRDPRRRQARGAATCTCMRSRRSKCITARRRLGLARRRLSSTGCAARGSAACRAPRRKSSTTRCARCSARTSSRRAQWLAVVEAAHRVGLRTTATIMFGHVDRPEHWARHLLHIRDLQERTGGFTEFVPLPFVHMEAPIYLEGPRAQGPDLPRDGADARGGAARAASADSEHPGVVGEARAGRRRGLPRRRRQRSRRHA